MNVFAEHLTAIRKEQPALTVASAKELAGRMAGMARIIRDLIASTFEHEEETIRLMAAIDQVIDRHGGWPIQQET